MRFSSTGVRSHRRRGQSQRDQVRHKVLVADDDIPFARELADFLREAGFECKTACLVSEAKHLIEFWQPDSVFVDLMLPESNALSLFRFLQSRKFNKAPKVIVMSNQTLPQGVETMRRAGASHYLIKPFSFGEALQILKLNMPERRDPVGALSAPSKSMLNELHLLNLFLKQAMVDGDQASLFNLMKMIGLKVEALRCSLIQCLDTNRGSVLASNDDENVTGLPLQLSSYPEIQEVRRTLRPLVIANVRTSDLLAPVRERLANTPFETLAVFPVFCKGRFFGVLSVRMEQRVQIDLRYVEKFGQVCSQIISLAIGSSKT